MTPLFDACLRSWPWHPWSSAGLLLTAWVYWRGWVRLRRRDRDRWSIGLLGAFWGGLGAIFLALLSPIDTFASFLLQVHMLQHLILMMAAPPLLWLGSPMFPLLRGLPRPIRVYWAAPLLRAGWPRSVMAQLTHPIPSLLLFAVTTWLWHVPYFYELALGSDFWHGVQHFSFLAAGLLFWYPVVRPYPSRPGWSRWWLIPYLLLADLQNTVLAALLTFADRILYPTYGQAPRLGNLSSLDDQAAAGVLMWVPGSIAFLGPLFWIGLSLLFRPDQPVRRSAGLGRISLNLVPSHSQVHSVDLLRWPLIGRFLRWRHARMSLQLPLLILAGALVVDGLQGPQVGAMNLAGVLPWIHWRGLVVLGLLVMGNVFCLACPFMLPRRLARLWRPARRSWPTWLRNKWLAILLIIGFLWSYEGFALWDSPWWTAWIVIAYFMAALIIDAIFQGASFCKYVCPIGQFHFVQSLISPMEIAIRDEAHCAQCTTKDCIRGREGIPGCEMRLFQPRKAGNLDCTFCLDCLHACPHDNIGLVVTAPGAALINDPHRSGIGRWSRRPDLAALVAVLVFGAFVNAAMMTGPVLAWNDQFLDWLGWRHPLWTTSWWCFFGLVGGPAVLIGGAGALSWKWGRLTAPWKETTCRQVFSLVPLGFAMWLTHYCFHFVTSYSTIVPAAQRFLADWGWARLGEPQWSWACCLTPAVWLVRLEFLTLGLGLLLSLCVLLRITQSQTRTFARALAASLPWIILLLSLFALGIWIVMQPMEMRGTMPFLE